MYTGSNPDLIDLQAQITSNLNANNAAIAGIQTQIKQVVLTLEGELAVLNNNFTALKSYVDSKVPA